MLPVVLLVASTGQFSAEMTLYLSDTVYTALSIVSLYSIPGLSSREPQNTIAYFAVSLVLNIFLTSCIICRLLWCKSQSQAVLGKGNVEHYNILSTLFIESAFMNALCSIFLLITNIQAYKWQQFSLENCRSSPPLCQDADFAVWDSIFQAMLAVTPAIQVSCYVTQIVLGELTLGANIGVFELSYHLPGYQGILWELEERCFSTF